MKDTATHARESLHHLGRDCHAIRFGCFQCGTHSINGSVRVIGGKDSYSPLIPENQIFPFDASGDWARLPHSVLAVHEQGKEPVAEFGEFLVLHFE